MTRPNPHIALIYHYDLARALAGEVVDWQAIPVNVDAGREGGDLCRAAADFAKRRDLFAMPAPTIHADTVYGPQEWVPVSAVPVDPNPAVEQQAADPEPSTASTTVPGPAVEERGEFGSSCRQGVSSTASAGSTPDSPLDPLGDLERAARRIKLRNRIKDLVDTYPRLRDNADTSAETLLRRYWPEGVPTLKHDGHTDAQLQLILACVRRVEAEVGAGWHPDDGHPQHVNTNPRASVEYPVATQPEMIDGQQQFDLEQSYKALGDASKELCHQIAIEANAAGRSISVSQNPTVRRWSIARAVIAWAAGGRTVDELWFAASNLATFEQCRDPSATLGGLISQFTIEQVDRLYQAAGGPL